MALLPLSKVFLCAVAPSLKRENEKNMWENERTWRVRCEDVKMRKCEDVKMKCADVNIGCANVKMKRRAHDKM